MIIDLIDETNQVASEHLKLVEDIIDFSSDYLQLPKGVECAITFVDNARIQEINRDYRGKDTPTDVISFALDDVVDGEVHLDSSVYQDAPHHLGDIILSIDRAREQAIEYGHSFERELGFLALHGFLHLNGYDHLTPEDEKEMFGLQADILNAFGLGRD
ncbi:MULTISPECIES: rRNA maturation RNase YbeY [unclassified Granulicatella]|uniref:rRNA maturation RNase YbeY n=1 Tax=unclassified Granulicatella TaxID=2630493 RepID=UPI001073EA98|nr:MULTISPECIES: rRNA maturation RNase YbeY [unclassified Granulicatella]MBF0780924.1 rRNA maturation RNase YbeY [Granulicatella sp. 19428wC4_WM01]TFU93202.1 rRNA maturation RNase YbeY [Granulicatella sp. WM01]